MQPLSPQPSKKIHPPSLFLSNRPLKTEALPSSSSLLKIWYEVQSPNRKGEGVHTMWHKVGYFVTVLHPGILIPQDLKLSNAWKSSWDILTSRCFPFVVRTLVGACRGRGRRGGYILQRKELLHWLLLSVFLTSGQKSSFQKACFCKASLDSCLDLCLVLW